MTKLPNNIDGLNPKPRTKKQLAVKIVCIVLAVIVFIVASLTITFLVLKEKGRKELLGNKIEVSVPSELEDNVDSDGDVISYGGKKYVLNENIVSVLCMGIDKEDISDEKNIGVNGQADCIFLSCLDTKTGLIKIIPISRETMVDVNLYSVGGEYIGVEKLPLCLAYAYGKDGASSSENVKRSVSRILYGVEISSYFAIDIEGFKSLTDIIGGVTVTSPEAISNEKYSIKSGETLNLKGDKAVFFIRNRGNDVNANNLRMVRQKQFFSAMISKVGATIKQDFTKIPSLYSTAMPFSVTDLNLSRVTFLASCALSNDFKTSIEYLTINGTTAMGEKYVEFTPDPASLYEVILKAFYVEK